MLDDDAGASLRVSELDRVLLTYRVAGCTLETELRVFWGQSRLLPHGHRPKAGTAHKGTSSAAVAFTLIIEDEITWMRPPLDSKDKILNLPLGKIV
jgi:hypothetical protein